MSKKSAVKSVAVSTNAIRVAAREGRVTLRDRDLPSIFGGPQGMGRGRLSKAVIEAFEAENPGFVFAGERVPVDAKTVEVPMFSKSTGRPVKPLTKTLAEVREASGTVGRKGRVSAAALHAAALAFGSGEPKAATVASPVKEKKVKVTDAAE